MDILNSGVAEEIEILEFKVGGNSYAVSVSDIREILPYNKKSTPIPNTHPFIEGIIQPRDFIIPIVNLMKSLQLMDVDDNKNDMIIVTSINDLNIAFHVDSVKSIHRISTMDIQKPDKELSTSQKEVVAGILERDDRNIEIIDLRKVIKGINPSVILD